MIGVLMELEQANPERGCSTQKPVSPRVEQGSANSSTTNALKVTQGEMDRLRGVWLNSHRKSAAEAGWNKTSGALIEIGVRESLSVMSPIEIAGAPSAEDLLVRAQELEQLASVVSYGADKARLKERAGRLRQQALQLLPGEGTPARWASA